MPAIAGSHGGTEDTEEEKRVLLS